MTSKLVRLLIIAGLLNLLTGCPSREPLEQPTTDIEAPSATEVHTSAEDIDYPGGAFVQHMHLHAAQLERLNAALDAGDLVAAGTPAYWLSRHAAPPDMPEDWRGHIVRMRMAAEAIEEATDLETARAAAGRIADSCRGCHESAGL